MTPEEFKQQGHPPLLKVFLESPTGKALIELVEDYGKPNSESRKQYGGAEDVKLQMSLNYVAMENTFAIVKFIKAQVQPATNRVPKPQAPDLIPEDATPEQLKAMGIVIPPKMEFTRPEPKSPEPVAP